MRKRALQWRLLMIFDVICPNFGPHLRGTLWVGNMYVLLTKREVKILAEFSFCVSKRKKRTRPIPSHLDRTRLVNKRFIIWHKEHWKKMIFLLLYFHSRWRFFWFHKDREITKNLFTLAENNFGERKLSCTCLNFGEILLGERNGQSRAGSIAPSCPLG